MSEDEPGRRITRTAGGRIAIRLEPTERRVLGALAADLAAVTSGKADVDRAGVRDPEADPALARLSPDAVPDDPAASDAFRTLTSADLEAARQDRFAVLADTIDRTELDEAQASSWLGAVNDLRLVLGTRLGVTEEIGRAPVDETDPQAGQLMVFLWLGWVEEQLVDALWAGLPEDPAGPA